MALSLLGLVVLGFVGGQKPVTPEEALRRSFDRHIPTNVDALVEKPFRTGELMMVRMVYDTSGRRRTEILAPLPMQGRIFVDDGKTWMTYSPNSKILKVHAAPPDEDLDSRMRLVHRNYQVEFDGKAVLAGRQALRIVATPHDPALRAQRFYIDAATCIPLKTETVDALGGVVVQFAVRRIGFPGRLDRNVFLLPNVDAAHRVVGRTPVPVRDRDEIERRLGFRPAMPHHLPMGFRPLGMDIMDRNGETPVASILTDGLARVFVFQSRVTGSPPPPPRPGEGPRVVQDVGEVRVEVRGEDVPIAVRERILAAYERALGNSFRHGPP